MTPLPPYLIVANAFTPTGGMERANHALALYLAERGGVVHLVGHKAAEDLLNRPNVRFHRVPMPMGRDLLGMPLVNWTGRHWARRMSAVGGRVIVNGGNCIWGDVNWVHYVHAAWGSGWKRRWFMRNERRALGRARLVVANSQRTNDDVAKYLSVDRQRIVTALLGADAERFRPMSRSERSLIRRKMGWADDEKVVLFVGAASDRRKGLDRLLAAWNELGEGWRLVTVGANGPARQNNVEWLGFRTDVEKLMGACDVLAAPSRYESYGLSVHEALCTGTPAIAPSSAGVAEVFPREMRELLIADVEKTAELTHCLRRWAANQRHYKTAATTLSESLRKRPWSAVAEEIIEMIEQRRAPNESMRIGMGEGAARTYGGDDMLDDKASASPSASLRVPMSSRLRRVMQNGKQEL